MPCGGSICGSTAESWAFSAAETGKEWLRVRKRRAAAVRLPSDFHGAEQLTFRMAMNSFLVEHLGKRKCRSIDDRRTCDPLRRQTLLHLAAFHQYFSSKPYYLLRPKPRLGAFTEVGVKNGCTK